MRQAVALALPLACCVTSYGSFSSLPLGKVSLFHALKGLAVFYMPHSIAPWRSDLILPGDIAILVVTTLKVNHQLSFYI